MSEELKLCPFCGGKAIPRTSRHTTRCAKMTNCAGGLNEIPIGLWNNWLAEKDELDEKKLSQFLYEWETDPTKNLSCWDRWDRQAKAICARFRPDGTNKLVEALQHIIEYWNQDENESAMADALWHIIDTARQALAEYEKGQ